MQPTAKMETGVSVIRNKGMDVLDRVLDKGIVVDAEAHFRGAYIPLWA
jgi:Gas vesicle protein